MVKGQKQAEEWVNVKERKEPNILKGREKEPEIGEEWEGEENDVIRPRTGLHRNLLTNPQTILQ